jgi:hypothetical protein
VSRPRKVDVGSWTGSIMVESEGSVTESGARRVWVRCTCGRKRLARVDSILRGVIRSCGECDAVPIRP